MDYVIFDSDGTLRGGYSQDLVSAHEGAFIEVSPEQREAWPMYRANAARDGVELAPVIPYVPTIADYTAAVQSTLDAKARERRYYDILSACTYATSTDATFRAEGQACVQWRDAVWAKSYDVMAQVQAGTLAQPTITSLLAMLPSMTWPA